MITLWLPPTDTAPAPRAYQVAGQTLVSSQPVADLAPFALPHAPELLPPHPVPAWPRPRRSNESGAVFADVGLLGGALRRVTCQTTADAIWLSGEDGGVVVVGNRGRLIEEIPASSSPSPTPPHPLLSSALVLALALQGTFCLHASAVIVEQQAIAFLGESGRGKSTLAAYLSPTWPRLVDDVLPVTASAWCWPHFPQPLPVTTTATSLPLRAVYVLAEGELTLSPLTPVDTALLLARHTIAAKLFPPPLLARHFDFCTQLGAKLCANRLQYPRQRNALPHVQHLLTTHPPAT